MTRLPEGNAIVYCEGAFKTPYGKTAHGLVRSTKRYHVLSVVDSQSAGNDAGIVLNGRENGIPIYKNIHEAVETGNAKGQRATHLVIGLAPDGGRLDEKTRSDVIKGIQLGLNVDSGLHDFLSEDPQISDLASRHGKQIRDIRKGPDRKTLHAFTGKIEAVTSLKVAVLGTDSAVGKRTTAWMLVEALKRAGRSSEFIGTGQTAWMQGAKYGIVLDALINDFVAGELEHAVWTAWKESGPDCIVIEGQGSLMNPAYPGGFEILAAGRPDVVILQHAPARLDYDGFPGYPIQPLEKQIEAITLLSGKPVVAVTINHESLEEHNVPSLCQKIEHTTGLPTVDVLIDGPERL
ncbi:MAG TPA: DUF1611 domain-containing protein, partial [Desulfobacterales bacterium]|nr:DUF1611 domain-containing protein [Desulfobacterales bacterium]